MGALSNIYVATASGSDITGDGSSGNPFATVQAGAFTLGTRDTSNGNYINLSGDDVLAATLSTAVWGTSTSTAPTVIRNWVGGPDGQGGLNGNAGNFQIANNLAYVSYSGITLHNTGSATIITIYDASFLEQCEIYDSTAAIAVAVNNQTLVIGNNLYNCGRIGGGFASFVAYNFLTETTKVWGGFGGIQGNQWGMVRGNILVLSDTSSAGMLLSEYARVINNSIYQTVAGTSYGISVAGQQNCFVSNNLIEGFSGSGGSAITVGDGTNTLIVAGNAVYNCTTAYSAGDIDFTDDNETLGASPFDKSGSNTFANRFVYFNPVNTGNVWGGAYPGGNLDKGAVNHVSAGGGSSTGTRMYRQMGLA